MAVLSFNPTGRQVEQSLEEHVCFLQSHSFSLLSTRTIFPDVQRIRFESRPKSLESVAQKSIKPKTSSPKTSKSSGTKPWTFMLGLYDLLSLTRFVPWKFLVSSVCAGGASCKQPFDRNQKVYHCQAHQKKHVRVEGVDGKWLTQVSNEKNTGYLLYIGDYTTQLYILGL